MIIRRNEKFVTLDLSLICWIVMALCCGQTQKEGRRHIEELLKSLKERVDTLVDMEV
jgi:hypothetical protein